MYQYLDKFLKSNRNAGLVFLGIFLCLCFLYNYQHELFVRPHGYHIWRQTDGFCVANNYCRVSMNFFQPRISQFISDDGLELAEFPAAYYISAIGYKILGFHEWIPRVVSLIIVFFGLWSLFRLLAALLSDHFYSIILSLFLFTSPVLISYSITPIPDVVGMSLALAGLYYFYKYLMGKSGKYLVLSFITYSIAGCIKPTSILSLLTIIAVVIFISIAGKIKKGVYPQLSKKSIWQISIFTVACLTAVIGWWLYVSYYRSLHHTSYFQVNANPIWDAKWGEIIRTCWHAIRWISHYFNWLFFVLLVIVVIWSFKIFPQRNKVLFISYSIYLFGCICYFLIFFTPFYHHDYYIIVILPLAIASLFLFITQIKSEYPGTFYASWFRSIILLLFIINMGYAAYKTNDRNKDEALHQSDHLALVHIEPYLDSISVKEKDMIIYWGDFAPNTAFYLMNRRGWGVWALGGSLSAENINRCKAKGAKFLIIDQNQCKLNEGQKEAINKYIVHKIGDRDSVQIYSLQ